MKKVAFLGGGVMAQAILRSLLQSERASASELVVYEPDPSRRAVFKDLGVALAEGNASACAEAEVVLLAVKPPVVPIVLGEIASLLTDEQIIVSIAAGVRISSIQDALPPQTPVIRTMPNTPMQVGAGAIAYCLGRSASSEDAARVIALLETGGVCVEVTEPQLDAVTGLSGSGPAFVCLVIEALADGGVRMGLPRATALLLAAQTVMGTGKLVLESADHPAVWRDRVATPGGTTIAGLAVLEDAGVRGALLRAVEAATDRAREL